MVPLALNTIRRDVDIRRVVDHNGLWLDGGSAHATAAHRQRANGRAENKGNGEAYEPNFPH